MKTWREAASVPERHELLEAAYQSTGGKRSEMAVLLGLSREHVSRLLAGRFRHLDHASHVDHAVIDGHAVTSCEGETCDGSVTTTSGESLTSGERAPRLAAMSAVTPETPARPDRRGGWLVSLRFSARHRAWLKTRALKKALDEGGRESVSAVVSELIQREIDQEEAQTRTVSALRPAAKRGRR